MAGMHDLGRKAPTSELDGEKLRAFLEQLRDVQLLNGRHVTGTMKSGQTLVEVRHGLGRAYRGAICTGTLDGVALQPFSPDGTKDNGLDPTKYVYVRMAATPASDITFQLWVW